MPKDKPRIMVLGDFIVDRYLYGEIAGFFQDLPILKIVDEKFIPGGAGNVAGNFVSMGADVIFASPVSSSLVGTLDRETLLSLGVMAGCGHPLLRVNQTIKTRTVSVDEKMQPLRLVARFDHDYELHPLQLNSNDINKAITLFDDRLEENAGVDAVVIVDHGFGAVPPPVARAVISRAKANGIPVFVDPNHMTCDWSKYSGASVIKANANEFAYVAQRGFSAQNGERSAGNLEFYSLMARCPWGKYGDYAHRMVQDMLDPSGAAEGTNIQSSLIVTYGQDGAVICTYDADSARIVKHGFSTSFVDPMHTDSTGAGDALFTAFIMAKLNTELSDDECLRVGLRAGTIVSSHIGTVVMQKQWLEDAIKEFEKHTSTISAP